MHGYSVYFKDSDTFVILNIMFDYSLRSVWTEENIVWFVLVKRFYSLTHWVTVEMSELPVKKKKEWRKAIIAAPPALQLTHNLFIG